VLIADQFRPASYQSRWGDLIFLSIAGMAALVMSAVLSDQIRPRMLAFVKRKVRAA
jgi:hypothetical protein